MRDRTVYRIHDDHYRIHFGELVSSRTTLMRSALRLLNILIDPTWYRLFSCVFVPGNRSCGRATEPKKGNGSGERDAKKERGRNRRTNRQTDGIIEERNEQRPAVWQSSCSHNTPRVIAPEYLLSLHPRSSFLDALIPPIRGQKGDEAARLRARAWQISLRRRHSRLGDHLSNAENCSIASKDMCRLLFSVSNQDTMRG